MDLNLVDPNIFGDYMEKHEMLLEKISKDMEIIKEKINRIETDVGEINTDLHEVKPEYIKKLKKINSSRFVSRKEFEKELSD